jgi:photosystem II stability/assembly factor-like uncharacterized protein
MKKLIHIFLALLLTACGALPAAPSQPAAMPIPTGTPDLQATGTAQVYASWTEMYQTLTAQSPQGTPLPTATQRPETKTLHQPVTSFMLWKLEMTDAANGWALVSGKGSYILRTADGGSSWQVVTPPQVITLSEYGPGFYGSLSALDGETAWVIADGNLMDNGSLFGTVWQTLDGGKSWRPGNPINIYTPAPETYVNGYETQLQFVDARRGWLRARIQLVMGHYLDTWFHTSDGGVTWERLPFGCADADWPSGCEHIFVDENTGFRNISSAQTQWLPIDKVENRSNWQIEKTTNAGHDWTKIELPPIPELVKNLFDGQGYTAAQISAFQITISKRIQKFAPSLIGVQMDFSVFLPKSFSKSVFVKNYQYLSADNGQTWRVIPFSGNLFFLDDTTGWRLSEQGGGYAVEKTSDGGVNWQAISAAALPGNGTLLFKNATTGWVIINQPDYSQRLMRTTDSGQTWTEISQNILGVLRADSLPNFNPSPTPSDPAFPIPQEPWNAPMPAGAPLVLNSIHMSDATSGWGTSLNGYIFHTLDGGRSWQDVTPRYGVAASQRSFSALDALHAWTTVAPLPSCLAGNSPQPCPDYYLTKGPVWATSDGGQTWQPLGAFPEPNRPALWTSVNLRFTSATLGWADWFIYLPNEKRTSYNLANTTDGGLTWSIPLTGTYQGPGNPIFLDQQLGFRAVKNPGLFLPLNKLVSGDATFVIEKTGDGGQTWSQISLPKFVIRADEIALYKGLAPVSLEKLLAYSADCSLLQLSTFGQQSLGVRYACFIPELGQFFEYYYSPDGGQSWQNWISSGNEFFLENGVGWRLNSAGSTQPHPLLHTTDSGATWTTIKTVGWDEAQFDFINAQEGWAIAKSGDAISLVHTTDGGQTWEEIRPVIGTN